MPRTPRQQAYDNRRKGKPMPAVAANLPRWRMELQSYAGNVARAKNKRHDANLAKS
jgi:hypothetical protein